MTTSHALLSRSWSAWALCMLVVLGMMMAFPGSGHADIIPKDMKVIHVTGYIENMDEYPEYVFVQYETLGDAVRNIQVIEQGREIVRGYKFNNLQILAVPAALFERYGGVDKLKIDDPSIARSGFLEIGSQELVPRDSPQAGKDVSYRVLVKSGTVTLSPVGEKVRGAQAGHMSFNAFGGAFLVTVSVELIVFILLTRIGFKTREPGTGRIVLSVVAAQAATLPFLWGIIVYFGLAGGVITLVAEGGAVGVEAVVYHYLIPLEWRRALIASLICNVMSFLAGVLA